MTDPLAAEVTTHGSDMPAVARVYGQPLTELPKDLYIPPDALEVFLDAFEGPLDLLLYLIRKQNLNILDIPMALLTQQYLEYVDAIQGANRFDLASEYLLMAAMMIEIKSRMLLPKPPSCEAEPEEDPRAQLVRRLLEYEQFKLAAAGLDQLPMAERDFAVIHVPFEKLAVQRLPEVSPDDLLAAWLQILARAKLNQAHLVSREALSVRAIMSQVLRRLKPDLHVEFAQLFEDKATVPLVVVTFLALLELARERLIRVTQAEPYSPIYVQLVTHTGQTSVDASEPTVTAINLS